MESLVLPFSSSLMFKLKIVDIMPKSNKEANLMIGTNALVNGIVKTAKLYGCSKSKVKYWKRKVSDHSFHPKQHGGKR